MNDIAAHEDLDAQPDRPENKCDWTECFREATHHPKLMIPSWDVPIQRDAPLYCIIGLRCCLHHALLFDAQEFLKASAPNGTGLNQDVFVLLAKTYKRPDCDFKRAFILPIPLDSDEAKAFTEMQKKRDEAAQPIPANQ